MKINYLPSFVWSLLLLSSLDVLAQTSIPVSFYSAGEVQAILSQPGCMGIRIYPIFDERSQANATMIIGLDAYGREIQNDTAAVSQYRMFTGISDNSPTSRTLTRNEAYAACAAYNARNSAFVSDMNAGLLQGLMGEGSLGVALAYFTENGNNFSASGYNADAGLQAFGVASPGDPCPTACGSREQYLISPQ